MLWFVSTYKTRFCFIVCLPLDVETYEDKAFFFPKALENLAKLVFEELDSGLSDYFWSEQTIRELMTTS